MLPFKKVHTEVVKNGQNYTQEQKVDWKSKRHFARKAELEQYAKVSTTQPSTSERTYRTQKRQNKFRTISASGNRDPNKSEVINALSTLILNRAQHKNRRPY